MHESMFFNIDLTTGGTHALNAASLTATPAVTAANTDAIDAWVGFKPDTAVKVGLARFVTWYRGYYGA